MNGRNTAPSRSPQSSRDGGGEGAAFADNTIFAAREGAAADAFLAAVLLAVDPTGLGGAWVRASGDMEATLWLDALRRLLPAEAPIKRMPLAADEDRVIGGLDLAAALTVGKRIVHPGLLAEAHGGALVVRMADRLDIQRAALIAAAMDAGEVALERAGLSDRNAAQFALLLVDNYGDDRFPDAAPPEILTERVAFRLDIAPLSRLRSGPLIGALEPREVERWADKIDKARRLARFVSFSDDIVRGLDAACEAVGVRDIRCLAFAVRAAMTHAALEGREEVQDADAAVACRLRHRAARIDTAEHRRSASRTRRSAERGPV